jgi:hypothetical protein
LPRNHLADVGIDGNDLDAHPDAGDESPQQEAFGRSLAGHDDGCGRVPKKRVREDEPTPVTIGEKSKKKGTNEQAGECDRDERADSCESKEGLRRSGQYSALRESRRDVAREKQIIQLKSATQ